MRFSLDVRRARKGDCFLLHYGTKENPGLILIDGGPSGVYKPQLKPRLEEIRAERGLEDDQPLIVDLLMVSHIDDDHINGILELTGELVIAANGQQPPSVKIRGAWHNSFDDVIGNSASELLAAAKTTFGAASANGNLDPDELDPDVFDHHSARVLAGVDQGFRLRDDIRRLAIAINGKFDGKLVMADQGDEIAMGKGLTFTVAGPMKAELVALQKKHDEFLKAEEKNVAALAAFTDKSVANLSSLVVLAEVDGKRMLLTGDARGDKILQGMEEVGMMPAGGKMHVELLKVPHHGSNRNMETGFFKRVTADHYVFSGDGEHGNPERETLEMLLEARGAAAYKVHLTYPVAEIDSKREKDWKKEQTREKARHQKNHLVEVRDDWSAAEHSLESFLAANDDFERKVAIVEEGKPHVIDLHDELGF